MLPHHHRRHKLPHVASLLIKSRNRVFSRSLSFFTSSFCISRPHNLQNYTRMDRYDQTKLLLSGIVIGAGAVLAVQTISSVRRQDPTKKTQILKEDIRNGLEDCIGNTPLIRIKHLSEATGCEILGKAEVLYAVYFVCVPIFTYDKNSSWSPVVQ